MSYMKEFLLHAEELFAAGFSIEEVSGALNLDQSMVEAAYEYWHGSWSEYPRSRLP